MDPPTGRVREREEPPCRTRQPPAALKGAPLFSPAERALQPHCQNACAAPVGVSRQFGGNAFLKRTLSQCVSQELEGPPRCSTESHLPSGRTSLAVNPLRARRRRPLRPKRPQRRPRRRRAHPISSTPPRPSPRP